MSIIKVTVPLSSQGNNQKVDKVAGKGLSTNDLTDELKAGYDIAAEEAHTHANIAALDSVSGENTGDQDLSDYIKKTDAIAFSIAL